MNQVPSVYQNILLFFCVVTLGFASGGLLGDVFLHLLPHTMSPHDHSHGDHDHGHDHGHSHDHGDDHGHDHSLQTKVGLWVLAGFFTFFVAEKLMRGSHGGHGHSHGSPKIERFFFFSNSATGYYCVMSHEFYVIIFIITVIYLLRFIFIAYCLFCIFFF